MRVQPLLPSSPHHVIDARLLGDAAALTIDHVVAMKAGGDELVLRRIGQQIAGELLHGEAVERQVVVERLDRPIAPVPHRACRVALVAVGVGVERGVEPLPDHPLAVARRGEQPVDHLLIRVGRGVGEERLDLFRRRRQADEVEGDASQERRAVGRGRRRKAAAFEAGKDEPVDGAGRPGFVGHGRNRRPRQRPRSGPRHCYRRTRENASP